MHPIAQLLADGPVAALHFKTGGGTSRACRAFISELTTLLNATDKKPLVHTTDRELIAISRFFQHADLLNSRGLALDVSGGQRFSDIEDYTGNIYIETQYGAPDRERCSIEIPEGRWLENRTPDSVARHELPVFDSERVSRDVVSLLDRWRDKLVSTATPQSAPTKSAVEIQYGDTDIGADPSDWDPMDPRRKDSALIEKVRQLRRAVFGRGTRAPAEPRYLDE